MEIRVRLIILSLTLFCSYYSKVLIKTKVGDFIGTSVNFGYGVHQFLGIPYAEPPVGDLRFKKPMPVKVRDKPFLALNFSMGCMNPFTPDKTSEDCLYLNIWKPASNDNAKLPVLFWIHGGGFSSGSANWFESGIVLSSYEIIVVTVNYRLGPYGFVYGNSVDYPGNLALWDQNLALKWVYENIDSFGGDNNMITVGGQDVGAVSAALHLISPFGKAYIKRVIFQSGSPLNQMLCKSLSYAQSITKQMAKAVKCDHKEMDQLIKCLKSAKTSDINQFAYQSFNNCTSDTICFPFVPSYGDEYIPLDPRTMLKDFKGEVEVLTGVTNQEGSPFIAGLFPQTFDPIRIPTITKESAEIYIKELIKGIDQTTAIEEITKKYISLTKDMISLVRKVVDSLGDFYFACPTMLLANELSMKGSKVYVYSLTHRSRISQCSGSTWMMTCHNDDIPFVFGHPLINSKHFTNGDIHLSLNMLMIWTKFVKTGSPPMQGQNQWPHISKNNISYMELNPNKMGNFVVNVFNKCLYVWNKYLNF